MPKPALEVALHCSVYASLKGYAVALFVQSRKLPATGYQYQLASIDTSDDFLPDQMARSVIEAWHQNYIDPDMRRLGVRPISSLYCNTLQYKQDIRKQFAIAKQKGWSGQSKPLVSEWPYYQVRHWELVESLSGDALAGALRNLSAAINQKQLFVNPDLAQKLRDEMKADYDWEVGVKAMPVTLAAFVQAFSRMPLKVKRSAAQVYLRRSVV